MKISWGWLAGVSVLAMACGGTGDRSSHAANAVGGTVVIAIPADVEPMIPPLVADDQGRLVQDMLFDHLAEIGDSLNNVGDQGFKPELADRWTWAPDSLSIAFHINPAARWHDGVPVRASDVRFTYQLYNDSAVGSGVRSQIASIDSVTVRDSLTAVFWFHHRDLEQFFNAVYQMYICPEHLLAQVKPADLKNSDFGRHPVGTGRFRIGTWTPATSVELIADTGNFRGRAKLDRVVLSITSNFAAAVALLMSGDADIYSTMRPENIADLAHHPALRAVAYPSPSYGFLWFNLHDGHTNHPNPVFGDRAIRRAIVMALDRQRMVQNLFDTLGSVPRGPFSDLAPYADRTVSEPAYDTLAAARVLDSAGWLRGADGIRHKQGRTLGFALLVPTSSKSRVQYAQLIQDQLRRAGMVVTIEAIEFPAFVQRVGAKNFDATIGLWETDPSPSSVRQTWETMAETQGYNWGSYSNPAFDAAIDSALDARDLAHRRAALHQAFVIIDDDVPAVWLYEPREVAGISRRIQIGYLRPDAWWAHLADWTIPPAQRIARDRIGLGAPHQE